MGLYCNGCITLKVKESACVCRVMYDIDHLPLELHELRKQSAKVDDLLHRLNWVVKHLVATQGLQRRGRHQENSTDFINCKEVFIMEAHKLARRDDAQTSKDAAQKVSLKITKMRQFVLDLIKQAGANGITGKEMTRAHLDLSTSSISSRPNELEKMGLVFYQGDKRDGSRVIRAIEHKKDGEAQTVEQLELFL